MSNTLTITSLLHIGTRRSHLFYGKVKSGQWLSREQRCLSSCAPVPSTAMAPSLATLLGIFFTSIPLNHHRSRLEERTAFLLANYLVESLGFSREHAESASDKVTVSFESLERPQMVVDFLKETGFDETHVRKMVNLCPGILLCGFEKTVKPKIEAFRSLGFFGSQIGTIFSMNPFVTIRGLNSHIVPTISVLNSVFTSNDKLLKAMKKTPWMLSDAVRRNFPNNVTLLQSYGGSRESIEKMILRRPQKLLQNPEWFENVAKRVEKKLGFIGIPKSLYVDWRR